MLNNAKLMWRWWCTSSGNRPVTVSRWVLLMMAFAVITTKLRDLPVGKKSAWNMQQFAFRSWQYKYTVSQRSLFLPLVGSQWQTKCYCLGATQQKMVQSCSFGFFFDWKIVVRAEGWGRGWQHQSSAGPVGSASNACCCWQSLRNRKHTFFCRHPSSAVCLKAAFIVMFCLLYRLFSCVCRFCWFCSLHPWCSGNVCVSNPWREAKNWS